MTLSIGGSLEEGKEAVKRKTKILVLDDSDFSRKNIIQILEKNKFVVVGEASNAKTAGDLITSTKANVLILDLIIPEKNGIELTKHFKENFHDLNVVIVSSLYHDQIIQDCIGQGATDFIVKPIPPALMCDAIEKIENSLKED